MRPRGEIDSAGFVASTLALTLLALLAAYGCGSDDDPVKPPGGTPVPPVTLATPFTGTFVNGSESGLLNVTIDGGSLAPPLRAAARADTVVTATGVLSPDGGGVVTLNGTYDTSTDTLKLSGQGYSFLGQYYVDAIPPLIDGNYTGPNGPGTFAGLPGSTTAVKVFCGTFESESTATAGRWNIVISGGTVLGIEAPYGDPGTVGLHGTVTGTGVVRTLSLASGGDFALLGQGTWNTSTNHVSGTWMAADDSGTWAGDLCLPGTAGD